MFHLPNYLLKVMAAGHGPRAPAGRMEGNLAHDMFAAQQPFVEALGGRHLNRSRRGPAVPQFTTPPDTPGSFTPVWEQKPQRTPGAQAFAWETIQMAAFTPLGPGVHAWRKRLKPFPAAPAWTSPSTVIVGLPRIAGQYVLQPLINPYSQTPPNLYGLPGNP